MTSFHSFEKGKQAKGRRGRTTPAAASSFFFLCFFQNSRLCHGHLVACKFRLVVTKGGTQKNKPKREQIEIEIKTQLEAKWG